jgi:hypothetical protein
MRSYSKEKTMRSRHVVVGALATAALGLLVWSVNADVRGGRGEQVGKDVVVTGRVIDLHCFMTGQMPSSDPVRCTTDCIRAGVPAALESDTGLFVLGQGVTGPAKTSGTASATSISHRSSPRCPGRKAMTSHRTTTTATSDRSHRRRSSRRFGAPSKICGIPLCGRAANHPEGPDAGDLPS